MRFDSVLKPHEHNDHCINSNNNIPLTLQSQYLYATLSSQFIYKIIPILYRKDSTFATQPT